MQKVNRLLANICTENLSESRDFYTSLFDFEIRYDSEWFVHLSAANQSLELGLISKESDIVPAGLSPRAGGLYLTLVVDDVDLLFAKVKDSGMVDEPPKNTFYGQRRMLLRDPNGIILDVSTPH